MRLIDADTLYQTLAVMVAHDDGKDPVIWITASGLEQIIDGMPTVDAVQVVRCKECTWYVVAELTMDGRRDKRYKPSYCLLWRQYLSENNYCSYGYKEKDETD